MNEQFDQLVQYVKQQSDLGVPEDRIRQILQQYNWNAELIDRAFLSIRPPQSPYPQASLYPETAAPNQPLQTNIQRDAPKKYRVFRAIGDTFKAIKNNAGAYFLSVILSYAVAGALLFAISFVSDKLLYGEFGLLFASAPKLLGILFGSLVIYTAWYAFAGAFTMTTASLALFDGSENRKSSIAAAFSQSLSKLGRVVLAQLLFCLVAFWPLVLMVVAPFILLSTGVGGGSSSFLLMPVLLLAALIWIYIAMLRFALAPIVAIFEPQVPVTKTLARSKHLLTKGGQWFLVKGFLLVLAILIVLAVATGQNLQQLMGTNDIAANILLIVVSVVINGVLVMLYRNRRIVRG